jgi:hydroxymethylbilane synthase
VRLGLEERATAELPVEVSLPAPGQGALGIECRSDDAEMVAILGRLHDVEAARCVMAERGVLLGVGGDCRTPLGAHARRSGNLLHLRAFIAQPDGTGMQSAEESLPWPATDDAAHAAGLEVGRRIAPTA